MNIQLSWDLFIIVFFVVIVAYSLIIGRDNTLKVILATYVSTLAADATGNMFGSYVNNSEFFVKFLKFLSLGSENETIIFVKVMVFVALVILFSVKGAFTVETIDDRIFPIRILLSVLYAGLSAGLIISTILIFVSGISFVTVIGAQTTGSALLDIYNQSQFVRSIVGNLYLWFSIPALAFLIQSLTAKKNIEG